MRSISIEDFFDKAFSALHSLDFAGVPWFWLTRKYLARPGKGELVVFP